MTPQENARFQRALQFAENHRPSGGFSNLYIFHKSIDGVPTGEAYGMNLMTDYGFERFFQDKATNIHGTSGLIFPTRLYVGNDVEGTNFKTASSFTVNPSYVNPATVRNYAPNNLDYFKYPMWYDSNSGLISLMCKYLDCYFPDQANGGPTTDLSVISYGIGEAINQLWTHSWLYDLQGDRVRNFTKYPNERLDIEVFFVLTYDSSLITSGWTNGKYCAMTTLQRFIQKRMGYMDESVYTYRRNNVKIDRGTSSRTIDMGTNSNATIYHTISPFEIYKTTGDGNGYIDGFIQISPGYICVEQQLVPQETPENVSVGTKALFDYSIKIKQLSNNNTSWHSGGSDIDNTSIADAFGYTDKYDIPFTNLNVTALNLYNFKTGQYNNPTVFQNNQNHQYTETPLQKTCSIPIYYTNTTTGNIIEAFLHINPYPNDPILKFMNGNTSIYATDSYWDRGSWEFISDPTNIPQSLRTKHFYITSSDTDSLNPIRESIEFTLVAENGLTHRQINMNDTLRSGQYATCENYDYGYFVKNTDVYVPDKTYKYSIPSLSSGRTNNTHFCFRNMIVSIGDSNGSNTAKYYWTNLSDLLDPQGTGNVTTTQYSFYDATNGFSSGVTNVLGATYKTETTNGVIGFQSTQTDEFVVMYIEFEVDNPSASIIGHLNRRFKFTSRMGCCINDSNSRNRIAYFYNNKIYVQSYSVVNNQWMQTHEYDLPSGYAEPVLMVGLNDKLWVIGSSYMVWYDLQNDISGTGTPCDERITLISDRSYAYTVETTFVDEVLLLYQYTAITIKNGQYIEYEYPIYVKTIPYTVDEGSHSYNTRLYMKLKKIRTNTLALVMGHSYYSSYYGSFRAIADFGKYIKPPTDLSSGIDISSDISTADAHYVDWNRDGIYCYGLNYVIMDYGSNSGNQNVKLTHIIPIEYAMTHWITGTTRTITSINNIRHVSGKQWNIEVSNIKNTNYGNSGKPPGSLG